MLTNGHAVSASEKATEMENKGGEEDTHAYTIVIFFACFFYLVKFKFIENVNEA